MSSLSYRRQYCSYLTGSDSELFESGLLKGEPVWTLQKVSEAYGDNVAGDERSTFLDSKNEILRLYPENCLLLAQQNSGWHYLKGR